MTRAQHRSKDQKWFEDVESVVADPLRFKIKLDIGEDAYAVLRLRNKAIQAWDIAGAAATGAAVASSTVVATTFFAPTGFLAALGLAGAAVTPVGWIIAASVASGGAWIGISRYLKGTSSKRVKVVPQFINTPIDVLGLSLFELMAPLALKVAEVDGEIHESELATIRRSFIDDWGYDAKFIDAGLGLAKLRLADFTVRQIAEALAAFKKSNRDCNYESMCEEVVRLLRKVMEADGRIDQREEIAVDAVARVFAEEGRISIKSTVSASMNTVAEVAKDSGRVLSRMSEKPRKLLASTVAQAWKKTSGSVVGKAKAVATAVKRKSSQERPPSK